MKNSFGTHWAACLMQRRMDPNLGLLPSNWHGHGQVLLARRIRRHSRQGSQGLQRGKPATEKPSCNRLVGIGQVHQKKTAPVFLSNEETAAGSPQKFRQLQKNTYGCVFFKGPPKMAFLLVSLQTTPKPGTIKKHTHTHVALFHTCCQDAAMHRSA